jgi:hypothetical protein
MNKKLKTEIKEIIKNEFEKNKNTIPWNGMHNATVEKIEKLIDKKVKNA